MDRRNLQETCTTLLPTNVFKSFAGVDPAKPLVPNNSKGKLDVADADMVQVLHTSSNYGDSKKAGHVDFYFNGGRSQPFCLQASGKEALEMLIFRGVRCGARLTI